MDLFTQAPTTTNGYMQDAIEAIDREFGDGYAKKNPQLVGDFMKTCGNDLSGSIIALSIQQLGDLIPQLADAIEGGHQ